MKKAKRILPLFLALLLFLGILIVPSSASDDCWGTCGKPYITKELTDKVWLAGDVNIVYHGEAKDKNGHTILYNYIWFLVYEGVTYNISDEDQSTQPWFGLCYSDDETEPSVGSSGDAYCYFPRAQKGLDGAEIYFIAESKGDYVESKHCLIEIADQWHYSPPDVNVPCRIDCYLGDDVTLTCDAKSTCGHKSSCLSYEWYETDTGNTVDMISIAADDDRNPVTTKTYKPNTNGAGTFYYLCKVTDSKKTNDENENYTCSSVITVNVKNKRNITVSEMPKGTTLTEEGAAYSLTVKAKADKGTLKYQWYKGNPDKGGEAIKGATDKTLDVKFIEEGSIDYYCVLTANYSRLVTDKATVICKAPTAESKQDESKEESKNESAEESTNKDNPEIISGDDAVLSSTMIILIGMIVIGLLLAALIALLIVLIVRKSKEKKE